MKVKLNQNLVNLAGEPLKDKDASGNVVDITLKNLLINALLSPTKQETGMDKIKKYKLATQMYDLEEIDLSSEDITLLKNKVDEVYQSPLVVGQVFDLLENK